MPRLSLAFPSADKPLGDEEIGCDCLPASLSRRAGPRWEDEQTPSAVLGLTGKGGEQSQRARALQHLRGTQGVKQQR